MTIYKKIAIIGVSAAVMLGAAACSGNEKAAVTTAADTAMQETTAAAAGAGKTAVSASTAVMTAKEKLTEAESFAEKIQEAVADKDMEAMAALFKYPCTMEISGEETTVIQNRQEFLKMNPDLVFGDSLMVAVATVDTAQLAGNTGDVFMGDGEAGITFSVSEGEAAGIIKIHQ